MQPLMNTLDTKELLDYDNLSIITRPRPPRRRQSGISLIPFRPYVKCLTGVRQPFSFANGYDKWMVMGKDEVFLKQPNARCIGSLIEDCDISDVIRWDIEGESTHLPMVCKLWMIVDGAVVERGKPHLVQDAAIQVYTVGRNLRAVSETRSRHNKTAILTMSDRHRRQSWQDINEYYSVPYYQYTCTTRKENHEAVQCDLDNVYYTSIQDLLPKVEEETVDENEVRYDREETVRETIYHAPNPLDRVHITISIQKECDRVDRSTSTDDQLIRMFNLNTEKNELLLSSIANPYLRAVSSNDLSESTSAKRNNVEYTHRSTSTGDDYPHQWLRLNTDFILSNFYENINQEKEKRLRPPSPRQNQNLQADVKETIMSSLSSSSIPGRIQNSSSTATTTTTTTTTSATSHYRGGIDKIENENFSRNLLPLSDINLKIDSRNEIDRFLNDSQIQRSSTHDCLSSQRKFDSDYETLVSSFNHHHDPYQQHSCSTLNRLNNSVACNCSSLETSRTKSKSSDSTSTAVLASLLERYEKTLHERQRAIAVINDQLLDIDDILKHYREKLENSSPKQSSVELNQNMESYRDISLSTTRPKPERPLQAIVNVIRDKYRTMPALTSQEMIQAYTPPPPQYHITSSLLSSTRPRESRLKVPSSVVVQPANCDLCVINPCPSSAWIRYNERKIEELQKRIDLMLQIDDHEEVRLLLSAPVRPTLATVSQRIDDILLRRARYRTARLLDYQRTLPPHRYHNRLPHRLHRSLPSSPRPMSRSLSRPTTPTSKSVRICTQSVPPHSYRCRSASNSRPLVSILRNNNIPATKLEESTHTWRSKVDGKVYSLDQPHTPRYYRLYDDVGFREIYNFSRLLDAYLDTSRTSTKQYASIIRNYAVDQQMPSTVTSVA